MKTSNPFSIEEIIKATKPKATISPKSTRLWMEALAIADVGRTARSLFRLVQLSLLEPLSISDRLDILETSGKVVRLVTVRLHDRFVDQALPLPTTELRVAELVQDLSLKMVLGYKRIIFEINQSSSAVRLIKKKQLTLAYQRIQYYLGRLALTRNLVYRPSAQYLWEETVNNYLTAKAFDLHHKPVKMPEEKQDMMTVEQLFKQTLLFSLANPHRMSQLDMMRLFNAIKRWLSSCYLKQISGVIDASVAPFVILIGEDSAPFYSQMVEKRKDPEGYYILTEDLAAQLGAELDERGYGGSAGKVRPADGIDVISTSLLSRLMLTLGMGLSRNKQRESCSEPIAVTLGLNAIYSMLGGHELAVGQQDKYGVMLSEEEDSSAGSSEEKLHELVSHGWDQANEIVETVVGVDAVFNETKNETFFRIADTSDSGMQLIWDEEGTSRLQVGELMGLRLSRNSWRVTVCVVRWVRTDASNKVLCGVEVLLKSPDHSYIEIIRVNGVSENLPVLCEEQSVLKEVSVVTPCFLANDGDQVYWIYGEQKLPLFLNSAMDCAGSFLMFRVEQEKAEIQLPDSEVRIHNEDEDFDDLWDSL